ncbi:hypothetical protein PX971_000737 [Escherichia coli]|nr:hypothetical protein [Escherichia coli]EGD2975413.1 hypothetical protein [Escherichia coli]EKQ3784463.1 hypothetical protein [Escherichia coli]EKQ3839922.1 hypothetical protein [Escherichia coli]EKQ3864229.1 hypothetical protein [Escherichia coli]
MRQQRPEGRTPVSNPPGCTIFSVTFSNEGIEEIAVLTAGTREDNVASATARRANASE